MVKTHKPTYPAETLVGASRLYLDIVNYLTTAQARFLSVKLTPAREEIVNRIKHTETSSTDCHSTDLTEIGF